MQTYAFHPAAQEYPMMSPAEVNDMAADMKANGYDQRFPIYLFAEQIADGRNRYHAAQIAGVEPTYRNVRLNKGETIEDFIIRANEHRRHLTPEWLSKKREERVRRVAAARQEGKSTREIAEQENISQPQVRRDLQSATETGVSVEPPNGKVTGQDGRTRTATPAKKPVEKFVCETCKRRGIRRDCPDCAAGAGGVQKKPATASKNGRETATFQKDVETHLGHARAGLDKLARHYGLAEEGKPIRGDAEYKAIEKDFSALCKRIEKWSKGHAKAKVGK